MLRRALTGRYHWMHCRSGSGCRVAANHLSRFKVTVSDLGFKFTLLGALGLKDVKISCTQRRKELFL